MQNYANGTVRTAKLKFEGLMRIYNLALDRGRRSLRSYLPSLSVLTVMDAH